MEQVELEFGSGNRHRRTGVWSNYQRFIYFYSHNTSSFLRDVECSLRPSKTLMLFPPPLSFRLLRAAETPMPDEPAAIFYSFFPPVSAAHPRPAPACRCSSSRQRCILFTARVRCQCSVFPEIPLRSGLKEPAAAAEQVSKKSIGLHVHVFTGPHAVVASPASCPVTTLGFHLRAALPKPCAF